MIFRGLSNTVFRFVLRCAGAEMDGGVQTPPSRWWKIQRPSRARVNPLHAGENVFSTPFSLTPPPPAK